MKKFNIAIFLMVTSLSILGQNLKPGDGIRINFYNITENLTGDYFIQDNGNLHLPYLGMINSVDSDFNDLRNQIISEYSKIYKNPELSIQPLYRVDILGEVGKPGVYYLTGYETISDLLSLAGGETSDSNIDELSIIRNDSQMEIDIEKFLEGENNLADIGLESGDKVYVPRKWLVGVRDASVIVSGVAVLAAIASLFTR
ncbi:MAG: polysaccharide biosynthesis/export family protein [Ignavibacteriae bacterium]|nr:polysaccharide biosynthesis/export family protein [Ignavibacteriota bacterium]